MSFPVIDLVKTGNNIKRISKESGFSADMIRDLLGVSDKSNVYKWFRGEVLPTVDNLLAMSILFGVTINELIVTETEGEFCYTIVGIEDHKRIRMEQMPER